MSAIIEYRGERPPNLNEIKNMHFREYKRVRDRWKMLLRSKYGAHVEIPHPCRVKLTVYTSLPMDQENAAVVMKIPMDVIQDVIQPAANGKKVKRPAVLGLGWLRGDGPDVVTGLEVEQEKCPRKDVGFRLEFEAA